MDNNDNKKPALISMILVVILFMTVIGVTYAVFTYSEEGKVRNIVTTGNITFSYNEMTNGITLDNAIPIADSVGKKLEKDDGNDGFFDFNVSCTKSGYNNIYYEVFATRESVYNELDERYVKVYLTDGTTDEAVSGYTAAVPTYNDLNDSIIKDGAKQLYYGSFTNSGTQSFRLRMWVSDEYTLKSTSEHFKIKVNVEAND